MSYVWHLRAFSIFDIWVIYLFTSSFDDLLESILSNLRFLTTGKVVPDLLLNTGSDGTTVDSVKFDVVNFLPKLSLFDAVDDAGAEFESKRSKKLEIFSPKTL